MADARSAADGADDGEVDGVDDGEVDKGNDVPAIFSHRRCEGPPGGDVHAMVCADRQRQRWWGGNEAGRQDKKAREAGETGQESSRFEAVGGRTELQIRKNTGKFQ